MVRHSGRFVAYYRVSTDRQGESELGIASQKKAVADYLNGGPWTLGGEFVEVESGKRTSNRPQLKAAIQACRKWKATLLIAKLDRLSRNVAFIASLLDSNIKFVCCDMPEADKTFLQMLAVFAEWEREKISERTKAALAAKAAALAKEGKRLGGPKAGREAGAIGWKVNKKAADEFRDQVLPTIEAIRAKGASLNEIAAELNRCNIRTARAETYRRKSGGEYPRWTATSVRRILNRPTA